MRLTGTEDLRVQKTIEAIRGTFQRMLLEGDYANITVTGLCERARINKKTFYRYYPTLDDLLAELQQEYSAPYIDETKDLCLPADIEAITRAFFTYSAAQGELYDKITCSTTHTSIRDQMIEQVMGGYHDLTTRPEGWDEDEWGIYLAYVTCTPLPIYQRWVADGRRVPVDRLVEDACTLICTGARALQRRIEAEHVDTKRPDTPRPHQRLS